MAQYSEGFKERAVQMMMAPAAKSVAQVSRETGASEQTLYNWRNRLRHEGKAVPADPSNPENWNGENKLAVVIETAALNAEELAEYCRGKGLYVEQIARWREAAIAGAETQRPLSATERRELLQDRKKSCGARKRHWPRRLLCCCCKKNPRRSGGQARTTDYGGGPSDGD